MNPQTAHVAASPAKPIPFPIIFERALVGAVAALVVARPLVAGDDPGRLRLISGGGPVSFNLCVLILLVAAGVYRLAYAKTHPARWDFLIVPLLLIGVGVIAFVSSRMGDRYARPGLFIAWEWIALGTAVYLTRRVTASENDSRGLLNVLLASAVSVGGLGLYQWVGPHVGLPALDVVSPNLQSPLAGNDEFYPELNRPAGPPKAVRGTFDSPETLLAFLLLVFPLAVVVGRSAWADRRRRWGIAIPITIALAIMAALTAWPFGMSQTTASAAIEMAKDHPWLGIGPGNFTRLSPGAMPAGGFWYELVGTMGLVGMVAVGASLLLAINRSQRARPTPADAGPPVGRRLEFQLGGAAGLVLGFVWAFGEIPAEAPASEVFTLGAAAVFRGVLWFAAFAILETVRATTRRLYLASLLGPAMALVFALVSDAPGRPTILFPMFVLLTIAANLHNPLPEKADGPWARPWRVVGVLCALGLAIAYLVTACLPAWATASAVRQARMASRHFPERDREVDRAPAGPVRANALTAARGFLLASIVFPLKDAAERDPQNSALWLEIARWQRAHWRYQLYADPGNAARVADEIRRSAETAGQLDPHNPAPKRNLFEAFLLFRRNSSTKDPERLAALNKLISQLAEHDPAREVPLRYRVVQALLDRGEDSEALQAEVTTLLHLNREEGSPHGSLTPEQKTDVIERTQRVIKKLPGEVVDDWRR